MSGGRSHSAGPATAGFTLIEMLASVFLTSLVISVAVGFFINLSRATEAATSRLRNSRQTATIIDRVARDLGSAVLLVKRNDETDPLEHPWLFLALPSSFGEGADRVKFVARRNRSRATTNDTQPDLAMVGTPGPWITETSADGTNPSEAFLRFALVPSDEQCREAARRLIEWGGKKD